MTRILHVQKVGGVAGSENHLLTLLPRLRPCGYEPEMTSPTSSSNGCGRGT